MVKRRKTGAPAARSASGTAGTGAKPSPKNVRPKNTEPKARGPEDDAALWRAFAQNVDPLELKGRVPDTDADFWQEMQRAGSSGNGSAKGPAKGNAGNAATNAATGPSENPAQSVRRRVAGVPKLLPAPPTNQIDSRQVRRIGSGRSGIDARIDLHGMRQNEAHGALRVFLFRAVAKGHRMVLVITGKGSGGDGQHRFGEFVSEGGLGRGVLRRNVPLWLEEPDLRAIVVGYTTAHVRHGGEGALYVQLRRR